MIDDPLQEMEGASINPLYHHSLWNVGPGYIQAEHLRLVKIYQVSEFSHQLLLFREYQNRR